MFENLPLVSEGSYRVFVDRELEEIATEIDRYRGELWQANEWLARAIQGGGEVVVGCLEGFSLEEKRVVQGWAEGVQLAVLRLIDRELQSEKLSRTLE